jgi:Ca2+/H+ antiporter
MKLSMDDKEHRHHQHERQEHNDKHHKDGSYWKGAHRDWRVWAGVILMLVAILYYIMSEDFALAPHKQLKQPSGNNKTP